VIGRWVLLVLAFAMQALTVTVAVSQSVLTREDFTLIQDFEDTTSRSFAEHFANMVHQFEFCLGTQEVCKVLLQKRMGNFYLFDERPKSTFQSSKAATEAITLVLKQFQEASGLQRRLGQPQGTSDYIYLVFVEPELAEYYFDIFAKAHIIHKDFGLSSSEKKQRVELFKYFIDQQLPCIFISSIYPDNTIRDTYIWVRTELDEVLMRQCVAEEFYNSFGLDEGVEVEHLFAYEFSHKAGDTSLSEFDLLLLKILYSDELPLGSEHENTMAIVEKMVLEARSAYQ